MNCKQSKCIENNYKKKVLEKNTKKNFIEEDNNESSNTKHWGIPEMLVAIITKPYALLTFAM